MRVAPTDPTRVYITGYVVDNGMGVPEAALWATEDAGSNCTQLDTTSGQFQFGNQPQLMMLAVSPTDVDLSWFTADPARPMPLPKRSDIHRNLLLHHQAIPVDFRTNERWKFLRWFIAVR